MAKEELKYRFVNEQPDWNYWALIQDEDPRMRREREACQNERQWSFVSIRHESEAMNLPALRQEEVFSGYADLMDMPRSKRRKAVRHAPFALWHKYRNPDVAELLLVQSERRLLKGDPTCLAEAEAAEWIADGIDAPEAVELKAFACTLQAVARHLFGDRKGGDELFRSALGALGDCPAPVPWAFFFRTLSRARERQGRLSEAAGWLAQAFVLYRVAGSSGRCSAAAQWCLRRLARLHLRLNEPGRALAALAHIETDERTRPEVEAEVLLAHAACLAAFDRREPARAFLLASRERRRRIWYCSQRLPLEWWDARITLRLDDLEDAIPRFDAVRRQHLHFCNWTEACLASLDLLLAYERVGTGTRETRPDVFGELVSHFDSQSSFREVLRYAEERAALEAALLEAASRMVGMGIPEAHACQAFLERVQALPPAPSCVALLLKRPNGRRRADSASSRPTRDEDMRWNALTALYSRVRFIDELPDD